MLPSIRTVAHKRLSKTYYTRSLNSLLATTQRIPVILFTCSTFPPASQFGRLDPCRRTSAAVFTTLTTQAAAHCARGLNDARFLRPHHRVALNGSAYSRLCMYMCVCARRIVRAIICKFVVTYFSLATGMPRGFVAFRSSLHTHIYIFYSIYIHIDLYTCLPYLLALHGPYAARVPYMTHTF